MSPVVAAFADEAYCQVEQSPQSTLHNYVCMHITIRLIVLHGNFSKSGPSGLQRERLNVSTGVHST